MKHITKRLLPILLIGAIFIAGLQPNLVLAKFEKRPVSDSEFTKFTIDCVAVTKMMQSSSAVSWSDAFTSPLESGKKILTTAGEQVTWTPICYIAKAFSIISGILACNVLRLLVDPNFNIKVDENTGKVTQNYSCNKVYAEVTQDRPGNISSGPITEQQYTAPPHTTGDTGTGPSGSEWLR